MQENLFSNKDRREMNEKTEKGIDASLENANSEWREMALECLHSVALEKDTFTVNDVRDIVKMSSLKTHDNRAMGGIMKTGEKEGWIERTGQSIPSIVGHRVHIQVWRSRICKK